MTPPKAHLNAQVTEGEVYSDFEQGLKAGGAEAGAWRSEGGCAWGLGP